MPAGHILHIFNPETDFALAHGGDYFTPKATIKKLGAELALLPALWAMDGDYILVSDNKEHTTVQSEYVRLVDAKHLRIVTADDLKNLNSSQLRAVRPWGWNPSLRRLLDNAGVSEYHLPSQNDLDILRLKAHRRNTIPFHEMLFTHPAMIPCEKNSFDEIIQWCASHPYGYLKAPWSSSGRGIFRAHPFSGKELHNWIKGTLRRQGSILVEPDWCQELDFATEWSLNHGSVRFLGYSLFKVDNHSQYVGNETLTGSDIQSALLARGWSEDHLRMQQDALTKLIAPFYSGPLGIDCLYSPRYGFNLCVELNLRMTMGIVNLLVHNEINYSHIYG